MLVYDIEQRYDKQNLVARIDFSLSFEKEYTLKCVPFFQLFLTITTAFENNVVSNVLRFLSFWFITWARAFLGPKQWRCSLYKHCWVPDFQLSNISSLMVEIKNPERKGSKLPLWCMEDSDLGENPARADFQEHCHWLSAKAWPHDMIYQWLPQCLGRP